eukprot:scaffold233_cov548-Prasinococcus_capsulatus_cf.AAC.4
MAAGRTAGWLVLRSSASSSSYAHRLRVRATVAPLLALTSRSRLHTGTWRTAAAWLAPPHEQARGGRMHTTPSACAARPATPGPWRRLPGVKDESDLRLALTLPTGQSFRWRDTGGARSGEVVSEYVGVLGACAAAGLEPPARGRRRAHDGGQQEAPPLRLLRLFVFGHGRVGCTTTRRAGPRVLLLQERCGEGVWYRVLGRSQEAAALTEKEEAHDVQSHLAEYFNLQVSLGDLWDEFSAADERFRRLVPYVRGSRMLRQEPYECLFSFICSQNNHISRIHLMVDRLCARYGTQILLRPTDGVGESCTPEAGQRSLSTAAPPGGYFTFPTEKQLSEATEVWPPAPWSLCPSRRPSPAHPCWCLWRQAELRELGFGYRAKFIVETARALREKEGGGPAWLLRLREGTRQEAIAALCELPGVGPKGWFCAAPHRELRGPRV